MVTATAATEHNVPVARPVPAVPLASATATTRTAIQRLPVSFDHIINSCGQSSNASNSICSSGGGTSKLTKAAMARRFLLRGRKKATTNTPKDDDHTIESSSPPRINSHSVNSPISVITSSTGNSDTGTLNRKSIKVKASTTTNMKSTVVDVVPVATCVLCYDDMDTIDAHIHPIVCLNYGCRFNCCKTCTETILEQSADTVADSDTDSPVASKHQLHHHKVKCPNCRSDLSRTIYDTAVLRLIDRGLHDANKTLEPSQQLESALRSDDGLHYEIDMARKREAQFMEEHQKRSDNVPNILSNSSGSTTFDPDAESWYHYDRTKLIDVTLLCGLENVMTWYEQETVTRYYTSCNTQQLGTAAKLLYDTRTKLQQQQQQQQDHFVVTEAGIEPGTASNAVASTIYQLVEAGTRAR